MADLDRKAESSRFQMSSAYVALLGVLLVFASIVASVTISLRGDLKEGILRREAEALRPVTQRQIDRYREDELFEDFEAEEVMIYALMDTYGMEGALGLQLFNCDGESVAAMPKETGPIVLDSKIVRNLEEGDSVSKISFAEAGYTSQGEVFDVLEMYLPITYADENECAGFVRYAMNGERILLEIDEMDAKLTRQAMISFGSGSFLVSVIMLYAISRLRVANKKLSQEAIRLEAANTELEMLAKTSAVGAVASHLIHGLKNPLAGLRQHVELSEREWGEDDREDARMAAKRMQDMINDVVEVLRVDRKGASYSVTAGEFADEVKRKYASLASGEGKRLDVAVEGDSEIEARKFGIALLIVSNLTQNALEAIGAGGTVVVSVVSWSDRFRIEVSDNGSGFSKEIRSKLFSPGSSSKATGAGIGLAICKQLARHIEADLELIKSDSTGSIMRLEAGVN